MKENLPAWMERAMKGEYVESSALRRYLWFNFKHVLTEREHALHRAATLEFKARHAPSEDHAARYRQISGYFIDAEVAAIADSGLDVFEQQCCDRLLREYPSEIYLNRCDRCQCLLASPIACACVRCGHHWYDRRSEMIARATSSIYPPTHDLRAHGE